MSATGVAPAAVILGVGGMLTALLLLALGVLSTAGEWGNSSIQNTFLLVPQRGRVVAAKAAAMAVSAWCSPPCPRGCPWPRCTLMPDVVAWDSAGGRSSP